MPDTRRWPDVPVAIRDPTRVARGAAADFAPAVDSAVTLGTDALAVHAAGGPAPRVAPEDRASAARLWRARRGVEPACLRVLSEGDRQDRDY